MASAQYIAASKATVRAPKAQVVINNVTYDDSSIVDFEITDSLVPSDAFTIGSVVVSKLTLSLKTNDIIPTNAEIIVYFGWEGINEWVSLGHFYIDTREYINGVYKLSCLDKLIESEQELVTVTYPITMSDMFDAICTHLGLVRGNASINGAYQIIAPPPEGTTDRQMLGWIASAAGGNVTLNRNGTADIKRLNDSLEPELGNNCLWAHYITADTTIEDRSGNGHTGNATDITIDANGDPSFNGSTSTVDITSTNYAIAPGVYTIEVFFKVPYSSRGYSDIEYILSHKDLSGNGISIRCSSFLNSPTSSFSVYLNIQNNSYGSTAEYDEWNHFVIKRGTSGYSSYLNGALEYSNLSLSENYPDINYKLGTSYEGVIQWTAMYAEEWSNQQVLDRYNSYFKLGNENFKSIATFLETVGPDAYVSARQTNPTKTYSRLVCTYNDEGSYYEVGTGTEEQTITFHNPYMTQTIANNLLTLINGKGYTPFAMDWKGYPHMYIGDLVKITLRDSSTISTVLLNNRIIYKGGLKYVSDAPGSSIKSEFTPKGRLTQAVNQLNKTVVKQGSKYYGVTVDRDNGIKITRDDGLTEVIFNSDTITFKVNGVDAIYFDTISGKYKFNGTLEGVDGDFTGTMTAGTFDGGTITGATIRTADTDSPRIEITGTGIKTLNTAGDLHGLYSNPVDADFILLFSDATWQGVEAFKIINSHVGNDVVCQLSHTSNVWLELVGLTTKPKGNWNCSGASFSYLSNGSSNYVTENYVANQGFLQGNGVSGTFTTSDGKTVTISNGLITSIV